VCVPASSSDRARTERPRLVVVPLAGPLVVRLVVETAPVDPTDYVDSRRVTVFREDFPDDSDFPCVVVGGMGTEPSPVAMADSYILAATLLIDSWEGRKEPWMVCYPILYLCRHALELYLKDALSLHTKPGHKLPDHKLRPLIDNFRSLLRERLNTDIPDQLRNDLYTLADIDPDGQNFRYVTTRKGLQISVPGEYWVPLCDLRQFIEVMSSGIKKAIWRL